MSYRPERESVLGAACRMLTLGLTHGTSGNVSLRFGSGFAITPTGIPFDRLLPEDIVILAPDGAPYPGERWLPSSEWGMHGRIYQGRSDVHAIVHSHSPAATAVSCLGCDIPPFHYMIAVAGGNSIRCAGYATFGTEQLAGHALVALADRRACLLAHHGAMALGPDLDRALAVASETEFLADLYLRLRPLGEPKLLSSQQMAEVLERFRHYGQPDVGAGPALPHQSEAP